MKKHSGLIFVGAMLLAMPGLTSAQSLFIGESQHNAIEISLGESFRPSGAQQLASAVGISFRGRTDMRVALIEEHGTERSDLNLGLRLLPYRQGVEAPFTVILQADVVSEIQRPGSSNNVLSLGAGIAHRWRLSGAWSITPSVLVQRHLVEAKSEPIPQIPDSLPTPTPERDESGLSAAAALGVVFSLSQRLSLVFEPALRVGDPDDGFGARLGLISLAE